MIIRLEARFEIYPHHLRCLGKFSAEFQIPAASGVKHTLTGPEMQPDRIAVQRVVKLPPVIIALEKIHTSLAIRAKHMKS